jgi:hypothetical protein
MTEFNLSDLTERVTTESEQDIEVIKVEFVQEFIRLLKEKALLHKRETKWRQPVLDYWNFIEIIDKLAGDKLK